MNVHKSRAHNQEHQYWGECTECEYKCVINLRQNICGLCLRDMWGYTVISDTCETTHNEEFWTWRMQT